MLADVQTRKLNEDPQVAFFAYYYAGLNEQLLGNRERALDYLRQAVALFTDQTAGRGGPGYMWQVARLHLREAVLGVQGPETSARGVP